MKGVAFLCPGQGSQFVGMAEHVPSPLLKKADEILGYGLSDLMANGPVEVLTETKWAQPAILTVSVIMGRQLLESGMRPLVMAGHSLGEYSALVLNEALSFEDAVKLVHLRGKYMQEAVPLGEGTMAAILGAEDQVIEEVCATVRASGQLVEPANYNCPGQLVISGSIAGVNQASEMLKERGAKRCIPLQVSAPFHCSLLKPAADQLAKDVEATTFKNPIFPYVSNVDAEVVHKADQIREKLIRQIHMPVLWSQSLKKIVDTFEISEFIEVGPGNILSGHVKKVAPAIPRIHGTDVMQRTDPEHVVLH